jgi:hypothetical protein
MRRKPPFYYVKAILELREFRAVHKEALLDAAEYRGLDWTKVRIYANRLYGLHVVPVLGRPNWLTGHPSDDEIRFWKLKTAQRHRSEASNQRRALKGSNVEDLAALDEARTMVRISMIEDDGTIEMGPIHHAIDEAEARGEFVVPLARDEAA